MEIETYFREKMGIRPRSTAQRILHQIWPPPWMDYQMKLNRFQRILDAYNFCWRLSNCRASLKWLTTMRYYYFYPSRIRFI